MNDQDTDQGLSEYKAFIDVMVEFVKRQSVTARRIRLGEKIFHGYTEHDTKYNQFVRDLSPEQRELVAGLINWSPALYRKSVGELSTMPWPCLRGRSTSYRKMG